jgi:hypothetical protein
MVYEEFPCCLVGDHLDSGGAVVCLPHVIILKSYILNGNVSGSTQIHKPLLETNQSLSTLAYEMPKQYL